VDRHPYRAAVALTAALVAAAISWSCILAPAVHSFPGPARWWVPGDVWVFVSAAHFVAAGALPFVYEADPAYVYPPGMALLLAPIAAIGWWLRLSESTGTVVHKPQLWLLVAPTGVGTSFLALWSLRRLLLAIGQARRLAAVQLAVALVLVPAAIVYGHYEEVVVLGFLLEAATLTVQRRHVGAAWMLGGALLFKQTALLAVPVLLLQVPPELRRATAVRAFGPVGALGAICLLGDWHATVHAVLLGRSFPGTGRAALWAGSTTAMAAPVRVSAVLLAVVIGVAIRRHHESAVVLSALAAALLIRTLFEPVLFAYYLAVPTTFAVAAAVAAGARPWLPIAVGGALALAFVPEIDNRLWWVCFAAGVAALGRRSARTLLAAFA
jgi:hypothetical protein